MNTNIIERRNAEYQPLIESFKAQVKGLNLNGIIGPHFPGVGECYLQSKYKFAFIGWETYGWDSLTELMQMDASQYLSITDNRLNNYDFLEWAANWHATFWGFVTKLLARFYRVDFNELITNEQNTELRSILKSFIWGETNSIERFEVTGKYEGGNQEVWSIVKEASKSFDNLNHIINSCAPNVVFIVHSGASKEYFLNDSSLSEVFGVDVSRKNNVLHLQNEEMKYDYFYLRNTNTHLFKLPHPTWMGLYSGIGIDKYVDSIIGDMRNYHIWENHPESPTDWKDENRSGLDKSSRENKFRFVANLAHTLIQESAVMCGQDLASILNRNGIFTQYGTPYSEENGRGIYKLISKAWEYYHSKGDYQTAYDIARSYVNKNGEYAY